MASLLENRFHLKEAGTDVRTEILAGITTFMTMAYIIFVNPGILQNAGMPFGALMTATCLASALATFLMAFMANYPIALAPGMGSTRSSPSAWFSAWESPGRWRWPPSLSRVFSSSCSP